MQRFRFFNKVHLSTGEKSRISRFLRPSGTTMILPYDQFIEHDNRHRQNDSGAEDPDYIMHLAVEGKYDAVAIHYGVAKRYWSKVADKMPLILKINGKTSFPSQENALSVHTSWVEDALHLDAAGIGYTMYYGSPSQDVDIPQLAQVRAECDRYGLPLIVWAYPRGKAVDQKGGTTTSYALESAARMAMEMGATIIKSNLPEPAKPDFLTNESVPKYFRDLEQDLQKLPAAEQKLARARRVVEAAQGVPVLFSGGSEIGDEDLMDNAKVCVHGGGFGFIFGRNMWKRPEKEALVITEDLQKLLDQDSKSLF